MLSRLAQPPLLPKPSVGQSAGAESAGEESARAAEEQSAVRAAAAGCLFTMREALDASPRRAAEGVLLRVCC